MRRYRRRGEWPAIVARSVGGNPNQAPLRSSCASFINAWTCSLARFAICRASRFGSSGPPMRTTILVLGRDASSPRWRAKDSSPYGTAGEYAIPTGTIGTSRDPAAANKPGWKFVERHRRQKCHPRETRRRSALPSTGCVLRGLPLRRFACHPGRRRSCPRASPCGRAVASPRRRVC